VGGQCCQAADFGMASYVSALRCGCSPRRESKSHGSGSGNGNVSQTATIL